MITFKQFLLEAAGDTGAISHLRHLDDVHEHSAGSHAGTEHALDTMKHLHKHISDGTDAPNLTTKIDGSPAVVCGHTGSDHPTPGVPYVAYKGKFSGKTKTVATTHAEIDAQYEGKDYLRHPLHALLDHAHKVLPKPKDGTESAYQGDVLFHKATKQKEKNGSSFTPNLIKYTAKGNEAKKVDDAQVGVAFHTDASSGQPKPVDSSKLGSHPDIYNMSVNAETSKAHLSSADKATFAHHIQAAHAIHAAGEHDMHNAVDHFHAHMSTFLNKNIKEGTSPTVEGLHAHIAAIGKKNVDGVKTDAAKARHQAVTDALHDHITNNEHHISNWLQLHHHLEKAKDVIASSLAAADSNISTSVNDKKVAGEGHVISRGGETSKIVNKAGFSALNHAKNAAMRAGAPK